jgi:hypothetical protein
MKQGSSNTTVTEVKREPIPHAISHAGASQIGETVDKRAIEALHKGRGYKAPMAGCEVHHSGSQGKR